MPKTEESKDTASDSVPENLVQPVNAPATPRGISRAQQMSLRLPSQLHSLKLSSELSKLTPSGRFDPDFPDTILEE